MAQLLGFEKTRTILRLLSNFGTLRIVIFLYVFFFNMDIYNYLLVIISAYNLKRLSSPKVFYIIRWKQYMHLWPTKIFCPLSKQCTKRCKLFQLPWKNRATSKSPISSNISNAMIIAMPRKRLSAPPNCGSKSVSCKSNNLLITLS